MEKCFKRARLRLGRLCSRGNLRLLVELIRARLKASDFNSIFGVIWSLLGPFIMVVIMYLIFRGRFGSGVKNYALYLLVGIVFLNYFISTTTYLLKSLYNSRELVLNSNVPREDILLSDLFIHTYKFIIELIICVVLSLLYSSFTFKSLLLLLPLFSSYVLFIVGLSFTLSIIYSFAKDIEHIWSIFCRFIFFITPVFFTLNIISTFARKIVLFLNPLTVILFSFRSVILEGGNVNPFFYISSLFLGVASFTVGYFVFISLENSAIENS